MSMEDAIEYVRSAEGRQEKALRIETELIEVDQGNPSVEALRWNAEFMTALRVQGVWPPQ